MSPDSLTQVERLQLANQFEILEKLNPQNAECYAEKREILENGYTILYGDVFRTIYEELSMEQCRYVYDVLDMHRDLHYSYEQLADKSGIKPDEIRFRGFDGNNESKLYSFAEYLKKTGKWQETLVGGLNSHSMITINLYPKMLDKYRRIKEKRKDRLGITPLSADEIKEIIS